MNWGYLVNLISSRNQSIYFPMVRYGGAQVSATSWETRPPRSGQRLTKQLQQLEPLRLTERLLMAEGRPIAHPNLRQSKSPDFLQKMSNLGGNEWHGEQSAPSRRPNSPSFKIHYAAAAFAVVI